MSSPRLLFLLNPGRQSRHYIQGLARAAERLRIPFASLEMQDVWDRTAANNPAAYEAIQTQLANFIRTKGITHALGYAHNGVADFGLIRNGQGPARPVLTELGVKHFLLWTDHPEWAAGAVGIQPPLRDICRDPSLIHILKSPAAATEASQILNWPNVISMPMAEDYDQLPPATGITPIHDVVAIMGDCQPFPQVLNQFLTHEDPDPQALDQLLHPVALDRFLSLNPDQTALAKAWLEAKAVNPDRSFASLALGSPTRHSALGTQHLPSLSHLRSNPQLWYSSITALRTATAWRRFFWPAWLARRVNVGIYGSSSAPMNIPHQPEAANWVPYEQQPAIYARGKMALNTNAAHDEEGLTHKPFQIAASNTPLLHHHTRGLSDCFIPTQEVLTFTRGPELLDQVRSLSESPSRRAFLAEALHARARQDHTWDQRLQGLLSQFPH